MADVFVLIARFEGDDVTRMLTFPFFVQIARRRGEDRETPAPHVPVEDLNLLAWGEVYETEEDARHQRFD